MLQQPRVRSVDVLEQCEMAIVGRKYDVGAGYVLCQPPAMSERHHEVLLALHHEGGHGDGADLNAPVGDEGEIVVQSSRIAFGQTVDRQGVHVLRPVAPEQFRIHRWEGR
jgi:hypothetical protein